MTALLVKVYSRTTNNKSGHVRTDKQKRSFESLMKCIFVSCWYVYNPVILHEGCGLVAANQGSWRIHAPSNVPQSNSLVQLTFNQRQIVQCKIRSDQVIDQEWQTLKPVATLMALGFKWAPGLTKDSLTLTHTSLPRNLTMLHARHSPSCLSRAFAWSNAAMLAASRCDSTCIKFVENFCFGITACCLLVVEQCKAQTSQCPDIIKWIKYHEISDNLWLSFSWFHTSNCSAASLDRACDQTRALPGPAGHQKIESTTYTQRHK